MGNESSIQWTQSTWNPWSGCVKVSAGCRFCYMYRDKERYGQDPSVVIRSKTTFNNPLKWKEGKIIFTCSWSDWFIDSADDWRDEAWDVIKRTPHHTYQILTKRPERIIDHLPKDWGNGYENVWIGISAEDQDSYDKRIGYLSEIKAKVKFLSLEPLLSPINLHNKGINGAFLPSSPDWVIVGGESGNDTGKYRYRPCELQWIYDIVSKCQELSIPVFVKQLGTHLGKSMELKDRTGGDINEFPKNIQIREMPLTAKSRLN